MRLRQAGPRPRPISIVPLIDVMLILLVFFMVTSTYLDLDMLPAASRGDAAGAAPPPQAAAQPGAAAPLMVRLAADGAAHLEGRRLDAAGLARTLAARLAARPGTAVVVLASPRADMQALVGVIDAARAAGAARLSVVRLEGRP